MAELVVSMEQRMAVAFAACAHGPVNVTAFCAEHEISRQTFYAYRRRFQAEGLPGLLPRSRRPARSPSRTTQAMAASVLAMHDELREQGWDAGARSVRDRMLRLGLSAPSDRTIHRILAAHDRVKSSPRSAAGTATAGSRPPHRTGCGSWTGPNVPWPTARWCASCGDR